MKILIVSPYLPASIWGAGTRSYYLLKALSQKHYVSLIALADPCEFGKNAEAVSLLAKITRNIQIVPYLPAPVKRLQQLKDLLFGRSYFLHLFIIPEMQAALDALFAREDFEIVLFESVFMAGYHLPKQVKCIIDQHNVEYELLWRTYLHETSFLRKCYCRLEYRNLRPLEIARCQESDLVLIPSDEDCQTLQREMPDQWIEVIPNGVDTEAFLASASEEVSGQIIFTGTMSYYPNSQAALNFAKHCWPRIKEQVPGATWLIVGRSPTPEVQRLAELPGVTVTGSVPQVQPYLATSQVAIAPLLIGSGTRLKILEAFSMRKAVVSTSVGCEGLLSESGKHLLIADQPEAFAQRVVELLANPSQRKTLGENGRSLVEAEYSWEKCGRRLLQIVEKTILAEKLLL